MSYLLALDAGQAACVPLFSICRATVAVGQAEWQHLSVENVPGSMEFDLNTNWRLTCQCIHRALDRAHLSAADIQSVACCSMREGIVLYDRNGEAIWACANVDARASREVAELKEIHDNQFESEVYDVSGQTLALSAMPRLLWLAHHRPDIYRKAATITRSATGWRRSSPASWRSIHQMRALRGCWISSPATGGQRCWIWPGCAPISSPVKETGTVLGAITKEPHSRAACVKAPCGNGRRRRAAGLSGAGRGPRRANGGAGWYLLAASGQSAAGAHRS